MSPHFQQDQHQMIISVFVIFLPQIFTPRPLTRGHLLIDALPRWCNSSVEQQVSTTAVTVSSLVQHVLRSKIRNKFIVNPNPTLKRSCRLLRVVPVGV
jgi:hypothetical protein